MDLIFVSAMSDRRRLHVLVDCLPDVKIPAVARFLEFLAAGTPLTLKGLERQLIEEGLRINGGNRTRTAKGLGIAVRTLQYRLKEYGITHN